MDNVIWVDEKDTVLGEITRKEAHQKSLLGKSQTSARGYAKRPKTYKIHQRI